ncbi:hypothetical protein TESG_04392 [Trichophyton tonsurans CBS 112818]|uniref:Uncharacterized protein n=1 Tax=Trichophyton tonsurans (strain CBS 112818) TaxID=647933 RepID=F2S069_TRIT1|nr:hypothetical protein TESG_04392 [Trichophyton tonsurans CBS 112818]
MTQFKFSCKLFDRCSCRMGAISRTLMEVKCSGILTLKPSGIFLCIGSHGRRSTPPNQTLGYFSYRFAFVQAYMYAGYELPGMQAAIFPAGDKGCKSMGHLFSRKKEIPHREKRIKASSIRGSACTEHLARSKGEIPLCALSNRKTNPLSVSACCLACLSSIIAKLQIRKQKQEQTFYA